MLRGPFSGIIKRGGSIYLKTDAERGKLNNRRLNDSEDFVLRIIRFSGDGSNEIGVLRNSAE